MSATIYNSTYINTTWTNVSDVPEYIYYVTMHINVPNDSKFIKQSHIGPPSLARHRNNVTMCVMNSVKGTKKVL